MREPHLKSKQEAVVPLWLKGLKPLFPLCLPAFLLHSSKPDVTPQMCNYRQAETTLILHLSSRTAATLPQGVSAAARALRVVWMVSLSSPPTLPPRFSWLMSGQSNLPVFELPYSSDRHMHCTHVHKNTLHTLIYSTLQKGCHLERTSRLHSVCLFAFVITVWQPFALLSHVSSAAPKSKYGFMYFFIWSCPGKTRTRSSHFWFRQRESILDVLTPRSLERSLCQLHSCVYWSF